jgi:hypothetical protein
LKPSSLLQQHKDRILELKLDQNSFVLLSQSWGSQNSSFRDLLYQKRAEYPHLESSISHCSEAGGILFSSQPCGFDLELKERVSLSLVQRVSAAEEIDQLSSIGLHPAFLWTTKEASWKATRKFVQPATISSMKIEFLERVDQPFGNFDLNRQEIHHFKAGILPLKSPQKNLNFDQNIFCYFGACWTMTPVGCSSELAMSVCFR